jgi:hypothetical protein
MSFASPFAHLCQMYRAHTFSRVGPPKDILRMYRVLSCLLYLSRASYIDICPQCFLAVLVSIQLSLFILVNAMALWVDQLLHGPIKKLSSHTAIYDATFMFTAAVRSHRIL